MTTQNNEIEKKQPTKLELMTAFFAKDTVQAQLKKAVADNTDSFIASVIDLYTGDETLINCPPELVAMQALKAAVLKLPLVKSIGHAYIVPFKKGDKMLPQFIIGYKGLVQLAIRTNQYKTINADVVYEGEYRSTNKLTGEFDLSGQKKSDNVIGYFAYFETKEGFSKTLFMSKERVTSHAQKYSKSYNQQYSPWKTEFDAMAVKTVLRNLISHWGPISLEMQSAMTDEDRDVADTTLEEIRNNGNMKTTGFTAAEVVSETSSNQGQNHPQEQSDRVPF